MRLDIKGCIVIFRLRGAASAADTLPVTCCGGGVLCIVSGHGFVARGNFSWWFMDGKETMPDKTTRNEPLEDRPAHKSYRSIIILFQHMYMLINYPVGVNLSCSHFIKCFLCLFVCLFLSFFLLFLSFFPFFLSFFLSFSLSFFLSSFRSFFLPSFLPFFLSSFLPSFPSFFHSFFLSFLFYSSFFISFILPFFLLLCLVLSFFFLSFFLSLSPSYFLCKSSFLFVKFLLCDRKYFTTQNRNISVSFFLPFFLPFFLSLFLLKR